MSEEKGGEGKWLSAQQVANRYGLSRQWVYGNKELRRIGKLFGKYRLYLLSDIEEFERTRTHDRKTGGSSGYDLPREKKAQDEKRASRVKFTM